MSFENECSEPLDSLMIEFTGTPEAIDKVLRTVDGLITGLGELSVRIGEEIKPVMLEPETDEFSGLNKELYEVVSVSDHNFAIISLPNLLSFSTHNTGDTGTGNRIWHTLYRVLKTKHSGWNSIDLSPFKDSLVLSESGGLIGINALMLPAFLAAGPADIVTGFGGGCNTLLAQYKQELFTENE